VKGHGSHVTGTIAARNGNAKGITGLAPDAKVLMLKGLGDDGFGSWSALADAFDFAGDRGIRVVNASLGGAGYVPLIDDVVAMHPNTLYVVSAGNDNANLDTSTFYPCEAVHANVLCVGASDNRDTRASFSNYSPTSVDVFAPGVSVLSTTGGTYYYYNGTSMAAPHVTAEAALILQRDPTLTAEEVKDAIIDSADHKAALTPYGLNGGRANARAALDLVAPAPDGDGDGIADDLDNCPATANASQADSDGDGAGNACDAAPNHDDRDADGDGVANADDNCAATPNASQADADGDGAGDACDATPRGADADSDGVGALDDNCPSEWNADQADGDHDGIGDACDDSDGDSVLDGYDNCPATANANQADGDFDGVGDACDLIPRGGDGDFDGVPDNDDRCPTLPGFAGGCPVDTGRPPVTTPRPPVTAIPSLSPPKVSAQRCGRRACVRSLRVSAQTSSATSASVVVSQQVCKRGRCTWHTVGTQAAKLDRGAVSATLRIKLPAGRLRVTVTALGNGNPAQRTANLTLR
jgi:hypothetical protein